MTLEELQVLITAETKQLNKELDNVKKQLSKTDNEVSKITSSINKTLKTIGATLASLGIASYVRSATKSAMQFEASLQQINRLMGESASTFLQWADTQANAFGFARSEAVQFGAVYANLLSGFSNSTAETMQRTRDLLEASAVVASSTGRTMEDVMERIRSGLLGNTEAIEDLGINVGVAMIESTDAFRRFAGDRSWNQLDFHTQQTIRYFAILEQAAQKYGTELTQNTATRQAQFIAQLKDIRLYLGQAFLPVYNAILPALTSMAQALSTVTRWLAAFSQALFGSNQTTSNIQQQADAVTSVGDAYEETAKKAKKAVAGFDELNLIGGEEGAAGTIGTVGAATPLAAGTDQTGLLAGATERMDEVAVQAAATAAKVKAAFSDMFQSLRSGWNWAVATFGPSLQQALVTIQLELEKWKNQFQLVFDDIMVLGEPFKNWFQNDLIPAWNQGVERAGEIFAGMSESVRQVFDSMWNAVYPIIEKFVTDGLPRFTEFADETGDVFYRIFETVKGTFDDIWQGVVDPVMQLISEIIRDTLDVIFGWWDTWGKDIVGNIRESLDKIKELWNNLWQKFLKPIVTTMLETMKKLWDEHLKGLLKEIGNFVGKLVAAAQDIFNKFIVPIVNWLVKTLGPIFAEIFDGVITIVGNALGSIIDAAKGIIKALGGIVDFIAGVFTADWQRAWNGIKTFFSGIGDAIGSIFKGAINVIIDAMNWLINQINKIKIDVPEWAEKLTGVKSLGFNIPNIPRLEVGTNYVQREGLAYLHEGEAVVPKKYNPAAGGGVTEVQWNEIIKLLRGILEATREGKNIVIPGSTLTKAVVQGIRDQTRRTGVNPLAGTI